VRALLVLTLALLAACGDGRAPAAPDEDAPPEVVVASKEFTESVILGELATQLAQDAGATARHLPALQGSQVLFAALQAGEIDVYPEYTGTLRFELLASEELPDDEALRTSLEERGLVLGGPLGFRNDYAIGMRRGRAAELGIARISDLAGHPELDVGVSSEFLERSDGWPGLAAAYGLPHAPVGLAHDVAYRGVAEGDLDVIDLYTTDAKIAYLDLVALEDDRDYFPGYAACYLWRADLSVRLPEVVAALRWMEGRLDEPAMLALNAEVDLDGLPEVEAAAAWVRAQPGVDSDARAAGLLARLVRTTLDHLLLVAISLGAAILLAVPLGILAAREPGVGMVVLGLSGVLQTVPSLAMFVFLIPLLGIGAPPAIAALFVYSLLPIVRNTHAGLVGIPRELVESATALGLDGRARLRLVELPLATRSILAGVKTAAVINVGTATLGAFIGAGGYGSPIFSGIRRFDMPTILEGAIPAALLALAVQGLFELLERRALPRGLR
jgi:osmoprotectant transport system permease protein